MTCRAVKFCRLCGAEAASKESFTACLSFTHRWSTVTLHEFFSGTWNESLENFCPKHVEAIAAAAGYPYVSQIDGMEYLCCERKLNCSPHLSMIARYQSDFGAPTDEEIEKYLVMYLKWVARRVKANLPTKTCSLTECLNFAREKVNGRWYCGLHKNKKDRPKHDFYQTSASKLLAEWA